MANSPPFTLGLETEATVSKEDGLFLEFGQRRHERAESFANHGSVMVCIAPDISLRGRLKDFSKGGCLVGLIDPLPEIELPIAGDIFLTSQDFSKISRVKYKCQILRLTSEGIGVMFI